MQGKNEVSLIGHYGGDILHANSAWQSTSTDVYANLNRIPNLLKFLAKNQHHTPFEKSSIHFSVLSDIATHIQFLKHRTGVSINAESARYKEIKSDLYYIPTDWPESLQKSLSEYTDLGIKLYHDVIAILEPKIGRNRAKESARYFRGYNTQIRFDVLFNWRSFYHFYHLRSSKDAQSEIRDISVKMLQLIKDIPEGPFKFTIDAFGLFGLEDSVGKDYSADSKNTS